LPGCEKGCDADRTHHQQENENDQPPSNSDNMPVVNELKAHWCNIHVSHPALSN
jgi:hypothetical protein